MSEQIKKVLSNVAQSLTSTEQAQARTNIGAQASLTPGSNVDITNNVISVPKCTLTEGPNVHIIGITDPSTKVTDYTVSATDTTYSAGSGLSLDDGTFSVITPVPSPASGSTGKVLTVQNDNSLDWETPASTSYTAGNGIDISAQDAISVQCKSGGGLGVDSQGVYVSNPFPAPTGAGQRLVSDSSSNPVWQARPKFLWKTFFGVGGSAALTATDISNGYVDWPMDWELGGDGLYVTNFTFTMVINDASFYRGATSQDISGVCDKVKVSFWDSTHTWYSNDNAHGSDPAGMLFNDIPSSALTRVGGYPTLATPIRVVGGAPNAMFRFKGPSVRFMLNAGAQVGDTLHLSGFIAGINYDSGV